MSSPDEEIPGQIFAGCGGFIAVILVCLAALVGLIVLVVHAVK
jgi:hypothetical protein